MAQAVGVRVPPPGLRLKETMKRDPNCTLCPLHEGASTVCMPGRSARPTARVMIVGDMPGQVEDREGKPFVGAVGGMLKKLLGLAGVKAKDVRLTTAVRCKPPEGYKVKVSEMNACAPYLHTEIEETQPELVVLLGNAALKGALKKTGITKLRGQVIEKDGIKYLPTYHPFAVLRNPGLQDDINHDFTLIKRILEGEPSSLPEPTYDIIKSQGQLKSLRSKMLDKGTTEIVFDVETYNRAGNPDWDGLQPYRGDSAILTSLSISLEEGHAYVIPLCHPQGPWHEDHKWLSVLRYLRPAFDRPRKECRYINHNTKFDAVWLATKGLPTRIDHDTMLMSFMLNEERPKGLKYLAQTLLGADPYAEDVTDTYHMPLKRLASYNAKDTDYTLRLFHHLLPLLRTETKTDRVYRDIVIPAANALTSVEKLGFKVDRPLLEEHRAYALRATAALDRALRSHVPHAKREEFNFNSPAQVGKWLFGDLGLSPLGLTATGNPSTSEDVLSQLANEHEAVNLLLKYRKWSRRVSTFFDPWDMWCDANDRIHPSYKLFGTVTGRLSCASPNLQQVPRDKFLRGVFRAEKGYQLIQADFSQIELRIAAWLADETEMIGIYRRGEDMHTMAAARLAGVAPEDVTKEQRFRAKARNFGYLYGMGWRKFIVYAMTNYGVKVTPEESKRERAAFFRQFPRLPIWHEKMRGTLREYGYVESPLGRRRRIPGVYSSDEGIQQKSEREAINATVQSFASELTLMALHTLWKMGYRIVHTVHDSILIEVPEGTTDEHGAVIKSVMETPPLHRFNIQLPVPIVADLEVSTHWGE